MITERKRRYYEKECSKLTQPGANKIAYKALKNIVDKERSAPWSPASLYPDLDAEELAENLAAYFAGVSRSFPPLDRSLIRKTYDRPSPPLAVQEVYDRLVSLKTPKSAVTIDPLPRMMKKHANVFAELVTPIINSVHAGCKWPKVWASEEVTVIPKSSFPTSVDQCRNLSCTSIFSKL